MSPKWSIFAPSLSSIQPKVKLELSTEKARYSLGEQVKGQIKIASEEQLEVNQLVVQLKCDENIKKMRMVGNQYSTYQTEYWDGACIYNAVCRVLQLSLLPVGFSGVYPFSLDVSSAAKETLYSIDHNVRWHLFGVMETKGRPNTVTPVYEVQITRPQASQTG